MTILRRFALVFALACLPALAYAQADMAVSAIDTPDPVAPDGNISYAVTVMNNGPSATTNAHLNVFLNGSLLYQSSVIPAGWNCGTLTAGSGAPITCTAAALAVGTSNFTIVLKAPASTFGVTDTTIVQNFSVNSALPDGNATNDSVNVSTAYVAPDADMQITASDAPDPVAPDGNITYTVNVTNAGPDTAVNARMNVGSNGSLLYQSSVIPAGWNCGTLTVGSGAPITCTNPSFASGGMAAFSIVLKAPAVTFGVTDTTINEVFSTNSDVNDPTHNNDLVTVSTAYVAPDADMQITASDAPDPVFPDGNITYTVNVTNAGPDTAVNARMNVGNNGSLLYQSSVIPGGWNCGTLTVGSGAPITCTNPSFPSGGMATFSIVMKAPIATFGVTDTTINEVFSTNSDVNDPNHNNDLVTVSTAYVAPDADMQVTASDAPDPVFPNGNITYTVTVTNAGPDAAPNARLNVPMDGTLRFVSMVTPAGFNCIGVPAAGGASPFTCTNPSLASGGSGVFTIVLKADPAFAGSADTTLNQIFGAASDVNDPNHNNDLVTVSTAYEVPDANLSITAADAPDPVVPGNNVTFTINIGNAGPDAAANAVVTVPLQASLRFVSITSVAGFNCTTPAVGATGTITCTNASFANGGAGTYTLVAQVDPALLNGPSGSIVQNFSIGSNTHDPVFPNNSAQTTTAYQTPAVADVSITKTTQATTVAPGGPMTFTITAHNNGPAAASSVVVTDTLPATLLFQSLVVPAGFNCTTPAAGATGTITCNAASLANGASAVFTLNTTVANNATGSITNNATISAAETDGSGGNNGGSSSPVVIGPAAPASPIPTLSEWALLALAALLGLVAVVRK
jgi:uncharacterized repeat protein (TIGR01451 family)